MFKKILLPTALGITLFSGLAATALAQPTTGTISGAVLDPTGALIPHAQVTISNATGFSRTIESSNEGAFLAAHLAPGSYSVSISAAGFTPELEGSIEVSNDRVTQKSIKLGISVNQEIDVWSNGAAQGSSDVKVPTALSNVG